MALQVIDTVARMRQVAEQWRRGGKTVGFVPTMGALHEGHASLVRRARAENDVCVVSIFVNPLQFGPQEDLAKYPRTFDTDRALCEAEGADAIFTVEPGAMYDAGFSTHVVNDALAAPLCGRSRPGHFRGVLTVVAKLFNIVRPHRAYFGQKDYQQLLLIERMTQDLNFDIAIVRMPIVRDARGLALSSRNKYLSAREAEDALALSRTLHKAEGLLKSGREPGMVQGELAQELRANPALRLDYFEVLDAANLLAPTPASRKIVVAVAAFAGSTRLIDNVLVDLTR